MSTECCSLGTGPLSENEATRYAAIFKVLAEPSRLQLLSELTDNSCAPKTVNELTDITGLSQSTVSHHLKRLTDEGLVEKVRDGRTVTHRVIPDVFAELRTVLQMD
ncbi:ArsR/SmtB family transcription factor [Corynebacterium breve]